MFKDVTVGAFYSRQELAKLWGYKGIEALARGVVTPANSNHIILFVTKEKQASFEQYEDRLEGNMLHWEGPKDHFAEKRMLSAGETDDEINVFYRARHHSDFQYMGTANVVGYVERSSAPSRFKLQLS